MGRVVAWLVILGISAAVMVAVLIPRIAGATPYVVLTGSMQPELPAGTMVVVKPVDPDEIGIGAVVTYQLKSGEPAVVTHRVVRQAFYKGEPVFQTQGDANDVPDEKWVRPVQIRGVKWYAVPYLGYVTSQIDSSQRHIALIVVVAFLIGYAVYMFSSAARDRTRRSLSSTKGETP